MGLNKGLNDGSMQIEFHNEGEAEDVKRLVDAFYSGKTVSITATMFVVSVNRQRDDRMDRQPGTIVSLKLAGAPKIS